MIRRNIDHAIAAALADTPVVLLNGARQTGKSTLVKSILSNNLHGKYLTLDDATVLAAATGDPEGFLAGISGPVVLDEVQRAPDLFLAIKSSVDRERVPGRFLLTGSADVLLLPRMSESLAGRMEILTLWPFSIDELAGHRTSFVDAAFSRESLSLSPARPSRTETLGKILAGGFPEAVAREDPKRRAAWFGAYITTVLQRDVREMADIENLTSLPRLLGLLASRAGSLLNHSELSRSLGLPRTTLTRYMALLETTFLIQMLPPWTANLGKRLVKSPKVMLCDTGLMAYLLGADSPENIQEHLVGPLVENYAVMEIRKQLGWSDTRANVFHFREQTGREVDLIIENARGEIVAIEIKAAARVINADFKNLRFLRDATGERWVRGIVLYPGTEHVSFEQGLDAVPIAALAGVPA